MDFGTEFQPQIIEPQKIQDRSFAIIAEELGEHPFTPPQFKVVQRVIHASADFALGRSLVFHERAIESGIAAIQAGRTIVTDVQMVQVGIIKQRIEKYGGDVRVYISDADVMQEAMQLGITRAIVAVRKAAKQAPEGIYVVGNAPTALLEVIRLVKAGELRPSLVIGVPVGFVSAAESKAELEKLDIPFIVNRGRKGGSPAAAAAVNALAILAEQQNA